MQITRRQLLASATLSIPVLAAAGCGGAKPGGGGSSGNLTAWALTGGAEPVFRSSFKAWNTKHPNHKFTVQYFANDSYKKKIRTAVGSGHAPTLIYSWAGGTLADYVANEDVVDLTGRIPDLTERALPSVMDVGKVDGKQYAVPNNNTQPVILFTNKKLFKQAGVDVPKTWDDLLKAVAAFKSKGITPIALAGQSVWPELMWLEYLTDRIGGPDVFRRIAAGTKDGWSDPAVTKALHKITELVDAGGFGDKFGSVVADNNADVALLHTDRAAMLLQGNWVYTSFKTDAPKWFKEGNLGWTTFPTVSGGAGDPSDIVGNPANFFSVSAHASKEEQKRAITYLDTVNLDSAAGRKLLSLGMIPAVKGIEDQLATNDDKDFLTFSYSMVKDAKAFQLSWDQAISDDAAQKMLTNLSKVFLGQSSPKGFVTAMNKTISKSSSS